MIGAETVIHPFAARIPPQKPFRIAVEMKIDPADVNSEMISLGKQNIVG